MGYIPAKCPQCGANINVDVEKETGICEACGTKFVTEKVIQNTVVNNSTAYNIQNAVFNITAPASGTDINKQETAESPAVTDGEVSEGGEAAAASGMKDKATAAFHKGKAFMTRHGNIWQIVKFTLISLIAFLAEFATMYALQYGLEGVCGDEHFKWFIFDYAAGREGAFGTAGFIAMLGSKCIAEIISFTINRKKTFKANNNVVFSVIMYVITVIALILFTTWLAGVLGDAMGPAIGADAGNTISKMLSSIISFVVIFLMDKFVIMRNVKGKGEETSTDEETAADGETAEALAADTADGMNVTCDSTDAEENEAVTEISSGDRE